MSNVSIIIPFRAVDDYRLRNLAAVVEYLGQYLPRSQIIIAEHDLKSKLDTLFDEAQVNKILYSDDAAFNKSKMINMAVEQANGDVLVVCDADLIVDFENLQHSIAAVQAELDFVRPYSDLIDLDLDQSDHYLKTGELPDTAKSNESTNRSHFGERLCLAGGIFVINKSIFTQLGGFDERFRGWGGEDDAFSLLVQSRVTRSAIFRSGFAWHLWHPRVDISNSKDYARNKQLLRQTQISLQHDSKSKVDV